jgi:hypothetical protein
LRAAIPTATRWADHGRSHAINPTLYAKMPFDHLKDFAPVSMTGIFRTCWW